MHLRGKVIDTEVMRQTQSFNSFNVSTELMEEWVGLVHAPFREIHQPPCPMCCFDVNPTAMPMLAMSEAEKVKAE